MCSRSAISSAGIAPEISHEPSSRPLNRKTDGLNRSLCPAREKIPPPVSMAGFFLSTKSSKLICCPTIVPRVAMAQLLLWRFDHGALIEGQENDYDQHNDDCNRDKPLSSHREPFDD